MTARGTLSNEGVDVTTTVEALSGEGRAGSSRATAHLWCTMAAATPCTARVVGTRARIELTGWFYTPGPVRLIGPDDRVLDQWVPDVRTHGFRFEIAEFSRALADGHLQTGSMPWDATRRVLGVMDRVRAQIGVRYPGE